MYKAGQPCPCFMLGGMGKKNQSKVMKTWKYTKWYLMLPCVRGTGGERCKRVSTGRELYGTYNRVLGIKRNHNQQSIPLHPAKSTLGKTCPKLVNLSFLAAKIICFHPKNYFKPPKSSEVICLKNRFWIRLTNFG